MGVDACSLFNQKRFQNVSHASMVFFILYFPIGLVLFILRIFMSFQYLLFISVLPKDWLVRRILARIYTFFIGLLVTSGGTSHYRKEAKVIISNHISLLDCLPIEVIQPTKRIAQHTSLPSWLVWLLGFETSKKEDKNGSPFPVAYYPEFSTTNGRAGLMKFRVEMFKELHGIIQPMVILGSRPWFFPASISYISSTFLSDMLWTLISPYTRFSLCYLPIREIPENEDTLEEFVTSLQKDMAYVLDIEATNVTLQEKADVIKRWNDEEKRERERRIAASSESNSTRKRDYQKLKEKIKMVEQIKNVLPQVPYKAIQQDLDITKNVDATLTRFIDGTITYSTLTEEQQEKEKVMIHEKSQAIDTKISKENSQASSPASFSKNWKERHYSFQEKKRAMIEEAKRKYLERHPEYA